MESSSWQIRIFDGGKEIDCKWLPFSLSSSEFETLLCRLLSSYYTEDDILRGSLRRNMRDYLPIFECIREENEVRLGLDPFIIARRVVESSS